MIPLKNNFLYLFIILSCNIYSQTHLYSTKHKYNKKISRFGITAGYTNYILDSNVLFTKSQPGFLIGILSSGELTNNLDLSVGINYIKHRTIIIGKKDINAEPEDLKFKLENIDIPFILNYNFMNLKNNNLKIGVNAGFTFSLFQNYLPVDDNKKDYIVEPLNLEVKYLDFDSQNEKISLNTYVPIGLSTEYHHFVCNLRYNIGLFDAFKNAPFYNTAYETKAKQNYYSLSLTYFIN